MRMRYSSVFLAAMVFGLVSVAPSAQEEPASQSCKAVHADMVEVRSTAGCKPEHTACFLGEVDGNQGLRGTTYFAGDSSNLGPSTSPDFRIYSGQFEYTTASGMLVMRETGISNPTVGSPDNGVVTAYQRIVDATGDFAGATGFFFVSGFNRNQRVVTSITGQICLPAAVQ